jgi:formate dehydrogenase maturation protein FdhE
MAEPIANDWKAIHDRMQQIRAERSASFRHCPQCGSRGWVPNFLDGRQSHLVGYIVCNLCGNLNGAAPPRLPTVDKQHRPTR